jgi:4-hydroxy-2-oxoheptanedioate aldolase
MRMTLRERFDAGLPTFTAWSSLPEPMAIEVLAGTAFDSVTLDMQHGAHSEDSVMRCLPFVVARGKAAIVRIPVGRFDAASRALDFGADAVIAPMINSAADARQFAGFVKYPPVGDRSWGPTIALGRRGVTGPSVLAEDNRRTMALAMIETRQAYEALDDILAVDGIDGLFVGPSDLSLTWSNGARVAPDSPDIVPAVEHIAAACKAAGKFCGIYLVDVGAAGRLAKAGYGLFAIGAEVRLMNAGADSLVGAAKASL